MTAARWGELALYEIFEVFPFALLTAAAFRRRLRTAGAVTAGVAALYLLGLLRRFAALGGAPETALSILWIGVYLAVCKFTVRASLQKLLFILLSVLNYASLNALISSFLGQLLFARQLQAFPYCFGASAVLFLLFLGMLPPALWFAVRRIEPVMHSGENEAACRFLWLVPAVFCVFFYYSLYAGGGLLSFAGRPSNFLYALAVGLGGLFVLFLTIRMLEQSELALRLRTENYQLALQSLRFQSLQTRMEETRRARHDLRQCAALLEAYLRTGDTAGLERFVQQYLHAMPPDLPLVFTHHPALNALLTYYAGLAAAQGATLDAQVDYPLPGPLPDPDLAMLFGNLLENAVEACARQTGGGCIHLTVRREQAALVILADNPCPVPPVPQGDHFRSSKREGEGIGVLSIRRIAGQYGGTARFEHREGRFWVSVLLNP